MRRNKEWREELSEKLISSKDFRREYFLALLDEGYSWRQALSKTIKAIGIKEYADLSGFQTTNLISQMSEEKDIRLSTLERMALPIGVSLSLV